MNAKVAIVVIALLVVGLLVVLLFQINQPAMLTTATTKMPTITASLKEAKVEAPTLAHGFVMQTYAAFTPVVTPSPTSRPLSDAEVTIAISASTTELQMGERVIITVIVTNTGKLQLDQIGCVPYIYFEDGTERRFSDRPDILDVSIPPGSFLFDKYVLPVGYSAVTSFTLTALDTGTAFVKASVSALTRYSPTEPESWMGNVSEAVTIHVHHSSH